MGTCATCGMPLEKKEDYALGNEDSKFCTFCVNSDGSLKTAEEIFNGGVNFFLESLGKDKELAEKITRTNMKRLKYWQENPFDLLNGEIATEQEFAAIMNRL